MDRRDLILIKEEADRLQDDGVDIDTAYTLAVGIIAKRLAEGLAVTPFEARLLQLIEDITRHNGGSPASTTQIAVELGGKSRFTVYHHLSKLEERGLLCRPQGEKSGWALRYTSRTK